MIPFQERFSSSPCRTPRAICVKVRIGHVHNFGFSVRVKATRVWGPSQEPARYRPCIVICGCQYGGYAWRISPIIITSCYWRSRLLPRPPSHTPSSPPPFNPSETFLIYRPLGPRVMTQLPILTDCIIGLVYFNFSILFISSPGRGRIFFGRFLLSVRKHLWR